MPTCPPVNLLQVTSTLQEGGIDHSFRRLSQTQDGEKEQGGMGTHNTASSGHENLHAPNNAVVQNMQAIGPEYMVISICAHPADCSLAA